MEKDNLLKFIKKDYLLSILLVLSLMSLLRSLIIPLQGDEITYFKIGEQLLSGKYYLKGYPSTVTPILPFLFSFFSTPSYPIIGFGLMKCFNIFLAFCGFRFLWLFLKQEDINISISISILLLTLTNTNSIAWFSSLYPESILFFSFWGFVYYFSKEINVSNFKKLFFFFLILTMTRYLYVILGLPILFYYYKCFKSQALTKVQIKRIILYSVVFSLPVLFWFKYVYQIEQNNLSAISYFDRFKKESGLLFNIKSGLGLVKHPDVSRINGIPAFITLFAPITGLRNFTFSILLIGAFLFGYFNTNKTKGIQLMFYSTIMVMLGLVFAGTGFSRYWLILLPCFYLGYYYVFKTFKFSDALFLKIAKAIAIIYTINEIRLDYLILDKYL